MCAASNRNSSCGEGGEPPHAALRNQPACHVCIGVWRERPTQEDLDHAREARHEGRRIGCLVRKDSRKGLTRCFGAI